ncbi:MAG: hypothetical protein ACLFVO_01400 [Chloroflexaceae bacterium]
MSAAIPLSEHAHFPLLGVPLEVRSNSPAVITAAERAFRHWRSLAPEQIASGAPLRLDLLLQPGEQSDTAGPPFVRRGQGMTMLAAGGSNLLLAQLDRGEALGFVTPELFADELNFRADVLEWLAFQLVSTHDRVALPAGAVVQQERAVLLVALDQYELPLLQYACLRAGLRFLAAEQVYLGQESGLRLWGSRPRLALPSVAQQIFPDLAAQTMPVTRNGETRLVLDIATAAAQHLALSAGHAAVCLVQSRPGLSSVLEPVDPSVVVNQLMQRAAGTACHQEIRAVAGALAQAGAYCLYAGSDLPGAAALVRSLV